MINLYIKYTIKHLILNMCIKEICQKESWLL